MTDLEQLAIEIADARRQGFTPGPAALERWHERAQAALAEARDTWLSEQAFRLRTGASAKWCRAHFRGCAEQGFARKSAKDKREWHVACRPPRKLDAAALEQRIVDSFAA